MSFWAGVVDAQNIAREEHTRKTERQQEIELRKAERDEQRAFQENQANLDYVRRMTEASLPLIAEARARANAEASQRAQLGSYFEDRLTDLDDDTKTAFKNLAVQDPEYSTALISTIKQVEVEKLGRRLTGSEILKMTNIFEKTKPEGVPLEEWVAQAASSVTTSGNKIDFDEVTTRLLSGELSASELMETRIDLLATQEGSSLGLVPDFDTSVVMGPDPQIFGKLRDRAVMQMEDEFSERLEGARIAVETAQEEGQPTEIIEDLNKKWQTLQNVDMREGTERQSLLLNTLGPDIIPVLAQSEPLYKQYFPQFFPVEVQGLTEDELFYLGVNQ
jgi:hypothetical protein